MTAEPFKPLILIVDDAPTNIQILEVGLKHDYRFEVVGSGKEAFDFIAKQGAPDLILLDMMMPEMDGYEVCRRLKQSSETRDIPVIIVSARNEIIDKERGMQLGAVDYIAKPFHLSIVKARLKNHLQLKLMSGMLSNMAWIDALTCIPNRRRFDESLDTEWKRAQRAGTHLSVIMVSVDHFKEYTDHYGHGAGEACLKKVASTLASSVTRAADLVARYGGEEFVLLIPETDTNGARVVAEQLRGRVEEQKIPHEYSSASKWVTISVGYASVIPGSEGSASSLLKEAGRMLHAAKNSGRNRTHGTKG